MALMNVYDKLVMGPDAGNQEGAIERKQFKHVGELGDASKAKVVVVYRTVPGEPNNCLVVGTKFLPDMYHNALMRAVESEGGQAENELGVYLARQTFPDGTNMLSLLHDDGYIKKFKTKDIVMTYGTLNKLNEMIAKESGVKVSELAVTDDTPAAQKKTTAKKTDAKETAAEE